MSSDSYALDYFLSISGFFLAVLGVSWYFRHAIEHHILQRIFAWNINREISDVNELLREEKTRVFRSIEEYRDSMNKDLTILDVGSGPAANLNFVPLNTKLVCLDPNPHYAGYLNEKLKKDNTLMKHIDLVQGYAEEMPFESETFDVVVCTLVLCSVKDIVTSLKEIKRVLKPGGKFAFVDHLLVDDKESWTYMLQLTLGPIYWLVYGCHNARDIEYFVKRAGFSDLRIKCVCRETAPLWLKRRIIGIATK